MMAMNMKVLTTQRGGNCLFIAGYRFRVHQTCGNKKQWKCVYTDCKSRCHTSLDASCLIKEPGEHSHAPEDGKLRALTLMSRMKRKCEDAPERSAKQLYNEILQEVNDAENADDLAEHFPQFHQVKSSMYRQRRKHLPPLPKTLDEVNIAPPYTETNDGQRFLLFNDGDGQDKILVFATDENVRQLCDAPKILMHGTFWTSPKLFHQLYTIHVKRMSETVPVVYALLPNKSRNTYARFFALLKQAAEHLDMKFNPTSASMDFEKPCVQAFRDKFPQAEMHGCIFHFAQCIWRKAQELGLATDFKDVPEIRLFIKRLGALCFVPLESLNAAWFRVAAEAPVDDRVTQLADYFMRMWLDDVAPTFSRTMWNHHRNMDVDSICQNYSLESFHYALNKKSESTHPNIFRLIILLKKEQSTAEEMLQLRDTGQPLPPKKTRYMDFAIRLQRLKTELDTNQRDLLSYLDACSVDQKF